MKKKLIYALTALLFVGTAGCDKFEDFGDTNVNPSATTQANVAALLTNSLQSLGGWATDRRPGWYGQYFSETQYTDNSIYSLNLASFTGNYSGTLYDLQNIQIENKSNNQNQVAKMLQQYIFWQMTDKWGDIPYSEALKGIDFTAPKYDKQEDIYKGMIKALTDASAAMDGSAITGDILNNGSVAAWKRVANSWRMQMALQLSKRYPGASDYAATQFKLALADPAGYISTNAQNLKIVFPNGFKNNIWGWYNGRKDDAESQTMTDLLKSLSDPRINPFGGASEAVGNVATSDIGMPYGIVKAKADAFTSANPTWARVLRGDLRTESSPTYITTAAQIALARAEAAFRGWTTEVTATVYAQGIALSFEQWGAGTPSVSYLASADVALTGTATDIKQIATQEWIAGYPDGQKAWNIWRRTGYPALTPAPDAVNTSKQIPRRYMYAASEYTSNATSVAAAVARLTGGDTMDAKIWWDQ